VVGDEQDRAAFVDSIATGLDESLADQRRLHGRWAQDLFQAVAVSLNGIRMIKDEDAGKFYFDQAGLELRLPDFRVVRADGEHLLVEVKNVGPGKVFRHGAEASAPRVQRLRTADVEALRRYAGMTGARLVFAHYWSAINHWTMIDSQALQRNGAHFELDIRTAMIANELGLLGDRVVCTTAQLALSLLADPDAPGAPADDEEGATLFIDQDSFDARPPGGPGHRADTDEVSFRIGRIEFSCNGQALTDAVERRIAQYLFFFGGGEVTTKVRWDDEERPAGIDLIWSSPAGPESPMVGSWLSSMYSARYILATKQPDGTITRFGHAPDTKISRLVPHNYWDANNRVLPLYLSNQRPNSAPASED
jgi:hypothetical protein